MNDTNEMCLRGCHVSDIFVALWLVLSGLKLLLTYAQLRITSRCKFVFNYYLLVDVRVLNCWMYLDRLIKTCHNASTRWFLIIIWSNDRLLFLLKTYVYFLAAIISWCAYRMSFIPLLLFNKDSFNIR